jgi:hypothetical protein
MAIENPSKNPFLGIYQKPQGKQPSNVGMGQPEDFLSSEEVIGRPDAQNTAQRSKASAKGLKDAYEAVKEQEILKATDLLAQAESINSGGYKQSTGQMKTGGQLYDGIMEPIYKKVEEGTASAQEQDFFNKNLAQFMAFGMRYRDTPAGKKYYEEKSRNDFFKPRRLAPMGRSETKGQEPQTSALTAHKWQEYDEHGNLQWKTSGLTAEEALQRDRAKKISLVYR